MSAGLLASLRAIPQEVDLPATPDGLAVAEDGQLVAMQRTDRARFGTSKPLGSGPRLGEGRTVLGRRSSRRAAQGAGVVVSGLVLGALALVNTGGLGADPTRPEDPSPFGDAEQATHSDPLLPVAERLDFTEPASPASPSYGLLSLR